MKISMKNILPAALAAMLAVACGTSENAAVRAADRVFVNGAIYTVDSNSWAEAVAVDDGRIVSAVRFRR
ncbi:MAG: hypothetical protein OEY74_02800 [Gammaproteobacteria bacterium]|nr:hypothetical protein [Gammaproteobacteria bacterium]